MIYEQPLDQLYFDKPTRTFPAEHMIFMDRFRLMLGTILAAHEPLSITSLNKLCGEIDSVDVGLAINSPGHF
jgi:hypothetical protein